MAGSAFFVFRVCAIVGHELGASAELLKPAHDGELRHQVFRAVDDRRSGEEDYPFLTRCDPLCEDGLLRGGVFDAVAFVDDDATEHAYVGAEDDIL